MLGLARGDVITVEETPFIVSVIEGGRLERVDAATFLPLPPAWRCPLCAAERDPGLDRCPNCLTSLAAQQGG